ncbi:cytochrome c3 family protein [Maribellus mangrovi]|uniref:cytochrome c3 family protein n=1 Tax=Maribellus mangrovi TaxID=3133146 RepID=UPI0030EC7E34
MGNGLKYGFLLLLMLVNVAVFAQISPGDLSKVHAHLEGLTNCTKCHVLGEQETTSKCLDCHKEIKALIDKNKGYHASFEVKGKKCAQCHGEHFGRDFKIVRFNEEQFDHNLAGFKLEGKHASIKCADCHKAQLIAENISQKKQPGTFLGMGTDCLSCHEDVHQNTLSKNCTQCHNQDAFNPASGFDHSNTDFALIGKHKEVECVKCHAITVQNGKEVQQFTGVKFASCTSCHEDVHQNKFGNDCTKCHNEFSFKQINTATTFNHNQTDYPLLGKHQNIDCVKCHKSGNYTRALQFQRCTDCHSDYHEGQLTKNDVSPDCKSCHSVNGFSPSSYSIERHNESRFSLQGSHMATPCFACHKKGDKWNFSIPETRCVDCHENIHKNVLDQKYMPESDCKVCHHVEAWKQIEFDHKITAFKLLGKHAEQTCRDCHFRKTNGIVKQQFSALGESCENCHKDIHFNQFEVLGKNDCARCHTFNNWRPDKFNHDDARFKLDGKHEGLQCVVCHKSSDDLIRNYVVYKFEDISCKSCH